MEVRAEAARKLVIIVSILISQAYIANCFGQKRRENLYGWASNAVQAVAFPLARALDKKAMVDQMVEEGWWG